VNRALIAIAAFALWSAGMFAAGWAWRGDRADGAEALQQSSTSAAAVEQITQVRATEHRQADALATIGEKHEEGRAAAEAVPAAVVADLDADRLRLRREWAGCETQRLSEAAAGTLERDALAARRAELAGAVVRVGREADDQLRACQAVIAADREG